MKHFTGIALHPNFLANQLTLFQPGSAECLLNKLADPLNQGPLKKWTEHSQELHLLKIHNRGAPITHRVGMGVDFLDHELL